MTPDFHDQVYNIKLISHVNAARFKRGDEDSCIVLSVGVLASSPHPITGFKDDSAYVTTKTADRNQRSTEDG